MSELQRAISIRPPWAWAVVHAGKDVENRSATAPRQFKSAVGQRVLMLHNKKIYASGAPEEFFTSKDPVVRQFVDGVADAKENCF